jgi:hypothetical protein
MEVQLHAFLTSALDGGETDHESVAFFKTTPSDGRQAKLLLLRCGLWTGGAAVSILWLRSQRIRVFPPTGGTLEVLDVYTSAAVGGSFMRSQTEVSC